MTSLPMLRLEHVDGRIRISDMKALSRMRTPGSFGNDRSTLPFASTMSVICPIPYSIVSLSVNDTRSAQPIRMMRPASLFQTLQQTAAS